MKKLAVVLSLALAFSLALAAEEHKAEPKKDEHAKEAKKPEAHKAEAKKPDAAHDAKPAAKHEEPAKAAAHEPAKHEEKPAPASPIRRAASNRITRAVRPTARPRAATASAAPAAAAPPRPAATPQPVVVQVKTEPTRVEAVLHVVPYGQPSVPAFAGAPQTQAPVYTVVAAPAHAEPVAHDDAAAHAEPAHEAAAFPQPAQAPALAPVLAPAPQLAFRNTLRAPKNALTNEGLVILAQSGYDEDFILDLMRLKNCRFDTSVEGLAYMANHGLTERIIRAALKADAERDQLSARN